MTDTNLREFSTTYTPGPCTVRLEWWEAGKPHSMEAKSKSITGARRILADGILRDDADGREYPPELAAWAERNAGPLDEAEQAEGARQLCARFGIPLPEGLR